MLNTRIPASKRRMYPNNVPQLNCDPSYFQLKAVIEAAFSIFLGELSSQMEDLEFHSNIRNLLKLPITIVYKKYILCLDKSKRNKHIKKQ